MTEEPQTELPDLNDLLEAARKKQMYWAERVKEAQAELEKANTYVDRLGGGRRSQAGKKKKRNPSAEAYMSILTALGNHSYAATSTLAAEAGYSRSVVGAAMNQAVVQGHATAEKRGKRFRFQITDAGIELVTAKSAQVIE